MKTHYEYILKKCEEISSPQKKILDYGCGKGIIIEEGLKKGFDFYGVESFSYGSGINIKEQLGAKGLLGERVKEISPDNKIPFPDNHFDLILSNQVFEHVVDIDQTLNEINRVLKKRGSLLLIFPYKHAIRECHCGILFAHWLPQSKIRYYWLLINRAMGFGRLKHKRSLTQWANFFNNWLLDSVTYRSFKDIHLNVNKHFPVIEHIEEDYMAFRLKKIKLFNLSNIDFPCRAYPLKFILRFICRKWGSLVFIAKK